MNKFGPKGKVKVVNASILAPEYAGLRFIVNICGQDGKFDAQLDKTLTKRWANVKTAYKEWHATQRDFKLGSINTSPVASDTWVVYMLVKDKAGKVDDKTLALAFKNLTRLAVYEKASIHISDMIVNEFPQTKDMFEKLAEDGINVSFYVEPVNKQA